MSRSFLSPTSNASYEKMHMLWMKFIYLFLLPEINITLFFARGGGGGGGGRRKGVRCDINSPKFDIYFYWPFQDRSFVAALLCSCVCSETFILSLFLYIISFGASERSLRKHAYSNILTISPPKTESFQIKNSHMFHISAQNIDCGYSLEPPRRCGSNEYPQSMFLSRNKKTNIYPCKPQFYYIKVGFNRVKIT